MLLLLLLLLRARLGASSTLLTCGFSRCFAFSEMMFAAPGLWSVRCVLIAYSLSSRRFNGSLLATFWEPVILVDVIIEMIASGKLPLAAWADGNHPIIRADGQVFLTAEMAPPVSPWDCSAAFFAIAVMVDLRWLWRASTYTLPDRFLVRVTVRVSFLQMCVVLIYPMEYLVTKVTWIKRYILWKPLCMRFVIIAVAFPRTVLERLATFFAIAVLVGM